MSVNIDSLHFEIVRKGSLEKQKLTAEGLVLPRLAHCRLIDMPLLNTLFKILHGRIVEPSGCVLLKELWNRTNYLASKGMYIGFTKSQSRTKPTTSSRFAHPWGIHGSHTFTRGTRGWLKLYFWMESTPMMKSDVKKPSYTCISHAALL